MTFQSSFSFSTKMFEVHLMLNEVKISISYCLCIDEMLLVFRIVETQYSQIGTIQLLYSCVKTISGAQNMISSSVESISVSPRLQAVSVMKLPFYWLTMRRSKNGFRMTQIRTLFPWHNADSNEDLSRVRSLLDTRINITIK